MSKEGRKLYFIAIIPSSPIYDEALQLKYYFLDHYNSKASLNSPPHITLHMPFQFREEKEPLLIEKLTAFAGAHHPFELELKNFGSFSPRVIFIHVEKSNEAEKMQKALERYCKVELNLFNAQYRDLPFHPHLTLAFRDLRKPMFTKAWEEFQEREFSGQFTVEKISLMKHDGKMWQVFQEFSLQVKE